MSRKIVTVSETYELPNTTTFSSTSEMSNRVKQIVSETAATPSAGSMVQVLKTNGAWPARPTASPDTVCCWVGEEPSPPIVQSGTGGMLDNVDMRFIL